MPNLVGLHQHDAYCVENLLLCETAITTILAQEMVITDTKAREQLGFSEWCRSIVEPMTDLFAAYATVNEFDPTIPTVGNPVGNLCTHSTSPPITRLDVAKVNAACNRAIGSAQAVAAPDVVTARHSTIRARISALADPLKAVSGKDYLLPLLSFHLNSFGCRIKKRTLRVRLADTGDRARFQRLSESLVLAARGAL